MGLTSSLKFQAKSTGRFRDADGKPIPFTILRSDIQQRLQAFITVQDDYFENA
jgi:hypothetical protein